MEFLTVDEKKCVRCGLCARVCPMQLIEFDERDGVPEPIEGAAERCINCGHCLAVCPCDALALAAMPLEKCRKMKSAGMVTFEELDDFLKSRRSMRVYKPESVGREMLAKLIDVARYAPSGINRQPIKWAVVLEREKVRQVAGAAVDWMRGMTRSKAPLAAALNMENIVAAWEKGADWICRGAPHLVLAYALKGDMTAAQAAVTALTYLELAAAANKLGACWAGYVNLAVNLSPDVRKLVGLPSRADCFGAMMVGYPGISYSRIPLRNPPHIVWR